MPRFTYADTYNLVLKEFDKVLEEKAKIDNKYYQIQSAFTINLKDKETSNVYVSYRNYYTRAFHFHLAKRQFKEYCVNDKEKLREVVTDLIEVAHKTM